MNLTLMMINDKARGRRGVKMQFKSTLIAVACTHTHTHCEFRAVAVTRLWMKHTEE